MFAPFPVHRSRSAVHPAVWALPSPAPGAVDPLGLDGPRAAGAVARLSVTRERRRSRGGPPRGLPPAPGPGRVLAALLLLYAQQTRIAALRERVSDPRSQTSALEATLNELRGSLEALAALILPDPRWARRRRSQGAGVPTAVAAPAHPLAARRAALMAHALQVAALEATIKETKAGPVARQAAVEETQQSLAALQRQITGAIQGGAASLPAAARRRE